MVGEIRAISVIRGQPFRSQPVLTVVLPHPILPGMKRHARQLVLVVSDAIGNGCGIL
ncbi:MAG: hypothetical protein ABSA97_08185 [Verrucomicrobiia bacterium]